MPGHDGVVSNTGGDVTIGTAVIRLGQPALPQPVVLSGDGSTGVGTGTDHPGIGLAGVNR